MVRGTFANVRLKNQLAPGTEGGVTVFLGPAGTGSPAADVLSIYDAAMQYQQAGVPLWVIAGKEYGSGSSRDWAAKGTMLLGVKAVIAESFERIHRSNLVNMGVLPLEFKPGESAKSLALTGREAFDLADSGSALRPRGAVRVRATAEDGTVREFSANVRIDTPEELTAFAHGGILPYVLRQLAKRA
jgi:aconitate hydratase